MAYKVFNVSLDFRKQKREIVQTDAYIKQLTVKKAKVL